MVAISNGYDRRYGIFVSTWPITFGSDGAGIVEAVGDDVKSYKPGDEVLAHFTSGNERRASFQVSPMSYHNISLSNMLISV